MRRALALQLLIVSITLLGCGDASTRRERQPTERAAPLTLTDEGIARSALLRAGDLPSEWTANRKRTKLRCGGIRAFLREATAHATSRTFRAPEKIQVEQTVAVYRDRGAMLHAFVTLRSGPTRRCVYREVAGAVHFDAQVVDVSPPDELLLDTHPYGRHGFQSRTRIPTSTLAGPVAIYLDQFLTPVARGLSFLVVISAFEVVDQGQLSKMQELTARRLSEAFRE
ncbi:MAG TPA: hypothetical protein VFF79_10875 [Conexibacter sp.]|jgi:hypothetical protein|nr:hypothetical protein [Conexibacter sp.]